jgi:LuxR family maltose regulon positive regulatory protein
MVYTAQLAKIHKWQGNLHQARALFTQAWQFAESRGRNPAYAMGSYYIGLGDLLREWNLLAEARQSVEEGIRQSELFEIPTPLVAGCAVLVQILIASGEPALAEAEAARALPLIQGSRVWRDIHDQFEASQVRLWLAKGDLKSAGAWEVERRPSAAEPLVYSQEAGQVALARIWIARKEYENAVGALDRLARSAEAAGRAGRLIEILALQALAQQGQGASAQALNTIEKCLLLAEPEGYVRVFLDEGEPMRELLEAAVSPFRRESRLAAYLARLLSAFSQGPPLETPRASAPAVPHSKQEENFQYLEPLSERELEVLRLICEGYSNQEIAEKLVITYNTVKKHNSNIFGKLGVRDRAQAILLAQQRKLI